jgi:iron complex transport system ATP-binding protein
VRAEGVRDDPLLHAALVDVFAGAIRIEHIGSHWIAIPHLEP